MVASNGHHPSTEEYGRRLKDADAAVEILTAELTKIEALLESAEQHRETVQRAAAAAQGVKRSKLTAAEKSKIIRERGLAAYQALPWD